MKMGIQAEYCFIENEEYGTFINGKNIEDIISKALPRTNKKQICRVSIEVEFLDDEIKVTKDGKIVKESEEEE